MLKETTNQEYVFNGEIGVVSEINTAAKLYKVRFDDKEAEYDSETVADLNYFPLGFHI